MADNTFKITLPPPLAAEVRRVFSDPRNPDGRLRHGDFSAFLVELLSKNKEAMAAYAGAQQQPGQPQTFGQIGQQRK